MLSLLKDYLIFARLSRQKLHEPKVIFKILVVAEHCISSVGILELYEARPRYLDILNLILSEGALILCLELVLDKSGGYQGQL